MTALTPSEPLPPVLQLNAAAPAMFEALVALRFAMSPAGDLDDCQWAMELAAKAYRQAKGETE